MLLQEHPSLQVADLTQLHRWVASFASCRSLGLPATLHKEFKQARCSMIGSRRADPEGPALPPGWRPTQEGQAIHRDIHTKQLSAAASTTADIRQAPPPPPEALSDHEPLQDNLFVKCLPDNNLNRSRLALDNGNRRTLLIEQAAALSKLRGPLFYSHYFVVCNLKKHIQLAPDFGQHERVYHPLCTFGPPSTADIEDSLNDTDRFGGCLLFQDREAADALNTSHRHVKQIVVIGCPPPALFSDTNLCNGSALEGLLLDSLVIMMAWSRCLQVSVDAGR